MRRRFVLMPLLAAFALIACGSPPQASEHEKAAVSAGEAWLAYLDAGAYGEGWDSAARLFKASVTRNQWAAAAENVYTQFGHPQQRKLIAAKHSTSLPGLPSGDYVVIQYRIGLANGSGLETLTMTLEEGEWKATAYFVRPE
nr:hypothetical protein [Gammaproteobacteria bacterium]